MPKRSTVVSRIRSATAMAVTMLAAAICASVAFAQDPTQSPAADALKQIIAEGNPAYLDWSTTLLDRDRIAGLYEAGGYRLLWSDGEKPTTAAINLLQELRQAADRGLDPEDYPGNRLAYLLIGLIDSPHSGLD